MKYSELGLIWQIPTKDICLLKHLNRGQYFIHWSHKDRTLPIKFRVVEDCIFYLSQGTSTRVCVDIDRNKFSNKSCNLTVIKVD